MGEPCLAVVRVIVVAAVVVFPCFFLAVDVVDFKSWWQAVLMGIQPTKSPRR
jgi:hypothetical protein